MRESNFAFPAQNKACVLITSTLYDRRALDTTSPLPLLNSLTHLTYLTSTSPRIREILTCDGGLERLVRLLRDFCIAPPPPENPSLIFGLSPVAIPRPPPVPTLNPKSFDRHAAFRFSLAFQCVVNIGVRGSESIRRRVVEAGTLDVVGCVLESWLTSKGFAVGPSASASGLPRETREQRALRRQQQVEQRQREQAQELARLLAIERQFTNVDNAESMVEDEDTSRDQSVATSDAETSVSTDTSANATPLGSGTPTGSVVVPGRDRSGTLMGRTVWDEQPARAEPHPHHLSARHQARTISRSRTIRAHHASHDPPTDSTPSASTSRPDTETEDDADPDGDIDMDESHDQENVNPHAATRHQHRQPLHIHTHPRRTVGIVADSPSPTAAAGTLASEPLDVVDLDSHIIINTDNLGDDAVRDAGGLMAAGVEDGIVALDQNVNDDLAMGAPPGAPGAIDATPRTRNRGLTVATGGRTTATGREEMTPRAVLTSLPPAHIPPLPLPVSMPVAAAVGGGAAPPGLQTTHNATAPHEARIPILEGPALHTNAGGGGGQATPFAAHHRIHNGPTAIPPPLVGGRNPHHHRHHHYHHHHHLEETGPFREDEVLLSLQLLAYLSKYPHVRQAFYKPRYSFHPATAALYAGANASTSGSSSSASGGVSSSNGASTASKSGSATPSAPTTAAAPTIETKESSFFNFKTITGRGKEKATGLFGSSTSSSASTSAAAVEGQNQASSSSTSGANAPQQPQRYTNVFSLVERFTFRPSPTESNLANPPPFLPPEIQYWAGVIMRNACRKDEARGGIRQCANMLCGKWENFPREFAKCRRCRKAKYCGKECQSRAWSEGHRFWCSAREGDDGLDGPSTASATAAAVAAFAAQGGHLPHGRHGHIEGVFTAEETEQRQRQQHLDRQNAAGQAGQNANVQRSVSMNVAMAARLQRREERERARQQMAAAAAAAMANIPPARLANAIRQRTQATNAAAGNAGGVAVVGQGEGPSMSTGDGMGMERDRERRRRSEHHHHSSRSTRGRASRGSTNDSGDGLGGPATNGESSSGGEDTSRSRTVWMVPAIAGGGGETAQHHQQQRQGDREDEQRARMQLQETMARLYARVAGGGQPPPQGTTIRQLTQEQLEQLMAMPNVNAIFSAHQQQQQQQQRHRQQQQQQHVRTDGDVDVDVMFSNGPGRSRAENMAPPIALPALQQQHRTRHPQTHQQRHNNGGGPLGFAPFGQDLSQAEDLGIDMDNIDVDVADADVDADMREDLRGTDNDGIQVVNLEASGHGHHPGAEDIAIGIVGEDGSVERTMPMPEEEADRMVLG